MKLNKSLNVNVGDNYRTFFDLQEGKEKGFWDVQIVEVNNGFIRYKWGDGKVSKIDKLDFFSFPFKKLGK